MKKERAKGLITGILITTLVFSLALPAAATVGKRAIEAEYNDIKIALNGEKITPTDAEGNPVEPFAVNGTTYLPVRAVGNALGMDVTWDGSTSTVNLENYASLHKEVAQGVRLYKELEDCAETGEFYMDILNREIATVLYDSREAANVEAYLEETSEHYPSMKETINRHITSITWLIDNGKTDYFKNNLVEADNCAADLIIGYYAMVDAYESGIAYAKNQTDANWDKYMDSLKAADALFFGAKKLAGTNYDTMFTALLALLAEVE